MYDEETITIDIDRLRSDMHDECIWGVYLGGELGTALMEPFDVDSASPKRLV